MVFSVSTSDFTSKFAPVPGSVEFLRPHVSLETVTFFSSCCSVQLAQNAYPVRLAHHFCMGPDIELIRIPGGMCVDD